MADNVQSVLVTGSSVDEIKPLLPLAHAIASATNSRVSILGLVPVPANTSLSTGALETRRLRKSLATSARRIGAQLAVRVAHDIPREVKKTIGENEPQLLLFHWHNIPSERFLRALSCDVSVVKPCVLKPGCRILLPIRGGQNAALALRIALALAETLRGQITVLHASSTHSPDLSPEFLSHLRELPQVTRWINARGDAPRAILRAARGHQLLIMGAIAQPRPGEIAIGPTAARVLNKSQIPALIVRARPSPPSFPARLLDLVPGADRATRNEPERAPVDYTISIVVDKWFAENTFHASEFQNLKHLVAEKEKQGLTVSLGLPALNEEKTIGRIVRMMQKELVERYPLLDEIVVIDSDSTDRTVEIASDLGVRVVRHSQILPGCGRRTGKGEALWKSLYELNGELIAWIDTDIVNIHPRFVYGVLGPLITNPELMYVKGFYQRPLGFGKKLEARGGGRVTELSARPLLNLFYPELSGFVQPLSGEYAGRRKALESVPFFSGYGVEIGLLIDIWSEYTLARIGQVDLQERIHRNQSLIELSKMAFEVVQVVMQRVGQARKIELVKDVNKSMKLIRYARDEFELDVADISERARQPMIEIAEYRKRRGL